MTFQVLTDGHQTLITFASNAAVKFHEKTVTPPGISGGGKNDTTTMRNTAWRTAMPKVLKELKESGCSVAYDPAVYDDIVAMVNVNQLITITFPDDSAIRFWGWLDDFDPKELKDGEQPTADIKIQCGNMNNSGNEVAPSYDADGSWPTTTTTAG